jgi:hypothetical protein
MAIYDKRLTDRPFWMTGNRDGSCAECENTFNKGDRIVWSPATYKAYCAECGVEIAGDDPNPALNEKKEALKRAEQKRANFGSKAANTAKKEKRG